MLLKGNVMLFSTKVSNKISSVMINMGFHMDTSLYVSAKVERFAKCFDVGQYHVKFINKTYLVSYENGVWQNYFTQQANKYDATFAKTFTNYFHAFIVMRLVGASVVEDRTHVVPYEVGSIYMTEGGKHVKIESDTKGCMACSDGCYRYNATDRRVLGAGRGAGMPRDLSSLSYPPVLVKE